MLGSNPCPNNSVYDELPLDLLLELFYDSMNKTEIGYEFSGSVNLNRAVISQVTPLNPRFFEYLVK